MSVMHIIIILGLAGFGAWVLYDARDLIRLGLSSYRWARTEGMIVDSHDDSFTIPGINQTNTGVVPVEYKETAHIYEYQVDGRTYRCGTYCFGGWSERAQAAYLIGAKVPVYYDPEHPEVAVLRRGLQPGAVFGIVPLAGAALLLYLSR